MLLSSKLQAEYKFTNLVKTLSKLNHCIYLKQFLNRCTLNTPMLLLSFAKTSNKKDLRSKQANYR